MARGLIVDSSQKKIVATPFPKFFNLSEIIPKINIPKGSFDTYEKVDGSLIIIFYYDGKWQTATKGSFISDQARWAENYLNTRNLSALDIGTTYLAEAIYPENRIVVKYNEEGLVLLGAYDENGVDLPLQKTLDVANRLGWRHARITHWQSLNDLARHTADLPVTEEGVVVRFDDGLRIKIKGDAYCQLHSLISRCTPLDVWHSMFIAHDLEQMRKDLPEEYWQDFDTIVGIFNKQIDDLESLVKHEIEPFSKLSDKDFAIISKTLDKKVVKFAFTYRTHGTIRRAWLGLSQIVKPKANVLPGYRPSSAMNLVLEE